MTDSMQTDSLQWEPDILGADFYRATLDLGPDPDGEGTAVATVVTYRPGTDPLGLEQAVLADSPSRPALLWVHGMSDYFFSAHVARHYFDAGYAFYALDLRKCGRSRRPGQTWHYATDLSVYYRELGQTVEILTRLGHPGVVPMGHSTGGLICSLWLDSQRPAGVKGLILNGPWLDMMNVPKPLLKAGAPVIDAVGKRWPKIAFPGGNLTAFGESMHASHHGEWNFDLEFKPLGGHRKYLGWLRAVLASFKKLHSGVDVGVPYLTVCSTRSILNEPYSEEINYVDCVVDVRQTMAWAPTLGRHCTLRPVHGARHEAFASKAAARQEVFGIVDSWLDTHVPATV
ncbi:alpha/beta hydrolase [Corynebacterium lizhenjunii]|uniref:alpha/beta hydrolase n=1 Tax=Corynebacterium lizhenjunii TaxID=2709394 RepID=UPI0013EADF43|nr:alpha/beta hydrolase [Corynebacterium lizhenjunii]